MKWMSPCSMMFVVAVASIGISGCKSGRGAQPYIDTENTKDPPLASTEAPREIESYKVGGVPIRIPPPTEGLVEVGYDNRELMEVMVPPENRLLCVFVLADDLPRLHLADEAVLSRYAVVQVPRRAEYTDCEAADFTEIVVGTQQTFGDIIASSYKEAEKEVNLRMESLGLDELRLRIGEPTSLGCLFSKDDAYGYGMLSAVSTGEEAVTIAVGVVMLRVKKRVLFLYFYSDYINKDTITWLRNATERWSDQVLAANEH